jgi:hypothetical protein
MPTGGVTGKRLRVGYSASSPITWTEIGGVTDAGFPSLVGDKIANDFHGMEGNIHRTMSGMATPGEPSVTVLTDWDPSTSADQEFLRARQKDSVKFWLRIEAPVDRAKTEWRGVEFECSVNSFEASVPINDRQTTKFTFNFEGDDLYWDTVPGVSEFD